MFYPNKPVLPVVWLIIQFGYHEYRQLLKSDSPFKMYTSYCKYHSLENPNHEKNTEKNEKKRMRANDPGKLF